MIKPTKRQKKTNHRARARARDVGEDDDCISWLSRIFLNSQQGTFEASSSLSVSLLSLGWQCWQPHHLLVRKMERDRDPFSRQSKLPNAQELRSQEAWWRALADVPTTRCNSQCCAALRFLPAPTQDGTCEPIELRRRGTRMQPCSPAALPPYRAHTILARMCLSRFSQYDDTMPYPRPLPIPPSFRIALIPRDSCRYAEPQRRERQRRVPDPGAG